MPINLKNKSKTSQVFNLPHAEHCAHAKECACDNVTHKRATETADGMRGTEEVTRRISRSVTFLAGETLTGLPESYLKVKSIKAALDRGTLRRVQ